MKSSSLSFRINAALLITSAIIAVLFGLLLYPVEKSRRKADIAQIEVLLASVFQQNRKNLANEIFANQLEALQLTIREMKQIKDIAAIAVFDAQGRRLLTDRSPLTSALPLSRHPNLNDGYAVDEIHIEHAPYLVFSSAIQVIGERVGNIQIYFDLTHVENKLMQNRIFYVGLLLATLSVMVIVLNLLLSRTVIRPANLLRNAMNRVQGGFLGHTVEIRGTAEIVQMGHAFNEMSTQLEQQHKALAMAIEAKKAYALKLEDINTHLEEMVQTRTLELEKSNQQLQQEFEERIQTASEKDKLQDRLERLKKMEALGLLAGGVAHDLNNVLSGMVSYPDLLLIDVPEDSHLRPAIEAIRDSGMKAAAIVQDLLTLARRGMAPTEVLNLNTDIIEDYLKSPEYHDLMHHHPNVVLTTDLAADLMNTEGSPVHLKKTLMNLVTNAVEAQPEGGKIQIFTENRYLDQPLEGYETVEAGDYVVLQVVDHGIGVSPEDLKRIFEPFYSRKVMGRSGTGLGMAVVWGTVHDHNGYIYIESKPRQGTTIQLYLPATGQACSDQTDTVPWSEYCGNGESVLVVDDGPEQRDIALRILAKIGYQGHAVASGEQALEFIRKQKVDLVVLDMIMTPGMDGLDTYKQLLLINPNQKAIIASGFSETDRAIKAQQLGASAYIKKPYTIEKIGMAIRDALQSKTNQG